MRKERNWFLIRCVLLAAALTLAACLGLAQALPAQTEGTEAAPPLIELDVDGYLLEFENLLPPSISYEAIADTPQADMQFSVNMDMALAELDAKAASVRAAQAAADGLIDEDEDKPEQQAEEEPPEAEQPEGAAAEEPQEEPEEEPEDEAVILPIFTMVLDEDQGDWVVLLTDEAGEVLPVAFNMAAMPEEMDSTQAALFTSAQEDVQILLATLVLKASPGEDAQQAEAGAGTVFVDDGELPFTAELAEYLSIQKTDDGRFEFRTAIGEENVTVYTLAIGSEEGDIVVMLTDAQGNKSPAAIAMAACPQELEKEEKMSFYRAQETVAQIMSTLALK